MSYYSDVCSVSDSAVPLVVVGSWCCLCEEMLKCILCEFLDGRFGFDFVLFQGKWCISDDTVLVVLLCWGGWSIVQDLS